jgi:hypothetical protein
MRSFFKAKGRGWKDVFLKMKMRKKMPAFTLVATSLAVLTWILIAQSFAMMSSGAMDTAKTQRVTAQAVEAAKLDEAALRNIAYDEIDEKGPHGRRPIEGMDDGSWESSVTIAPERTLSDGERTKVKMATIQIFRTGDTVSRFSLEVPLVSPDFNVKNDDTRHRISEMYDDAHKVVDTYVDRKKIYDNVKNDTSNYRISEKYDGKNLHDYVNDREIYSRVVNDSPGTKISIKYDGDTLNYYSNGHEISAPVPKYDWGHGVKLVDLGLHQWNGQLSNFTYVVPADGLIVVINCATDCDYSLWISGCRAYHKCGLTMADTGSFTVAKGDIISLDAYHGDTQEDAGWNSRQMYITFVPLRKTGR